MPRVRRRRPFPDAPRPSSDPARLPRPVEAPAEPRPARPGDRAAPYEEWAEGDLYARARDLGIEGRSQMSRDELIRALRSR